MAKETGRDANEDDHVGATPRPSDGSFYRVQCIGCCGPRLPLR